MTENRGGLYWLHISCQINPLIPWAEVFIGRQYADHGSPKTYGMVVLLSEGAFALCGYRLDQNLHDGGSVLLVAIFPLTEHISCLNLGTSCEGGTVALPCN